MELQVMAVYDTKARAFVRPFFVPHVDVAIRSISDVLHGEQDHEFKRNPDDYQLYHLGSFWDHTGTFQLKDQPELLGVVSRWRRHVPLDEAAPVNLSDIRRIG